MKIDTYRVAHYDVYVPVEKKEVKPPMINAKTIQWTRSIYWRIQIQRNPLRAEVLAPRREEAPVALPPQKLPTEQKKSSEVTGQEQEREASKAAPDDFGASQPESPKSDLAVPVVPVEIEEPKLSSHYSVSHLNAVESVSAEENASIPVEQPEVVASEKASSESESIAATEDSLEYSMDTEMFFEAIRPPKTTVRKTVDLAGRILAGSIAPLALFSANAAYQANWDMPGSMQLTEAALISGGLGLAAGIFSSSAKRSAILGGQLGVAGLAFSWIGKAGEGTIAEKAQKAGEVALKHATDAYQAVKKWAGENIHDPVCQWAIQQDSLKDHAVNWGGCSLPPPPEEKSWWDWILRR